MEDDYELHFEFITTAGLTPAVKTDFEAFQKELAESELYSAYLELVDKENLQFKYDEALNKNRPYINHQFTIETGKYMALMIGDTKAVVVALPLKECIKIPGIKAGSLFRKNVRQSLGSGTKVNKGIAKTIRENSGGLLEGYGSVTVSFNFI